MGIPGLYNHIGNGERIALSKFAVEHYMRYSRKLRIAIDASIWLFEVKSGRGGKNAEIRTFYYRLLKLLALGIEPVFVFDGPGRPSQKRNKKIDGFWVSWQAQHAKVLLDAFGFPHHDAPGEAEAECARLQMAKVVDAVMSEDVDTLMFGATVNLKNWSYEHGNKARTHIDVFRADKIVSKTGIDREGMVLIALLRGGDYDTVGVKGCGLVTACEAARGSFGHELYNLEPNDTQGFEDWRERLRYELQTNESGFFRTKHKSIEISSDFPSREVLHDYMHPLVSSDAELEDLRSRLNKRRDPDIFALRRFVAEEFGWDTLPGAKRLIRGLAAPLLTHYLCRLRDTTGPDGLLSVCGAREHDSTDGLAEVRVEILPLTVVPLDLENEPLKRAEDEEGQADEALEDDSGSDADVQNVTVPSSQSRRERSTSPVKKRAPSKYDPNEPAKFYMPEFFVRLGASAKVEQYEESLKQPKQSSPRKSRAKGVLAKTGMREGALDSFFVKTKINTNTAVEPPAKKQRPVTLARSKTDVAKHTQRDQSITNVFAVAKTKPPKATWAEKEYYTHLGRELHAQKKPPQPKAPIVDVRQMDSQTSAERSRAATVAPVLDAFDTFSSPVSSQELKGLLRPDQASEVDVTAPFSSPVSSQDLLQASRSPEERAATTRQKQANVRIRESLEGSWATASPRNERKGTRLRGIETVDMTT